VQMEIRKLKLKTGATELTRIPFDVIYLVRGGDKAKISEIFTACLILKPSATLKEDIESLPFKYQECHGLVRSSEKKRCFTTDKLPTYLDIYGKLEDEWLVVVPILTRSVGGEARPSYFVNRRVQAYLEKKHETMKRYSSQLGLDVKNRILNEITLQVAGKERSPCSLCAHGLLKSITWNHCQLGTKTCLEGIMLSKKETFSAKLKLGDMPENPSPEVAIAQG